MAIRPSEDPSLPKRGGRPADVTWATFQKVCASLALHGGKYKACEANHVSYTSVNQAIRDATDRGDDEWQELWEESYNQFRETLEAEAIRRHVEGVTEPIFDKDGCQIGERTTYSDRMGELLLKGHFPERYRDKLFVSGNVGLEPVDAFANLTAKAKREIRAIIMRDLEEQRQLAEARGAADVIEGQTAAAALADMRDMQEPGDEA